jgi:hypothetical protein
MRGNSVAVRVPRIVYQTSIKSVQVSGKAPEMQRCSPKEIFRQSREYLRTLTPSSPGILATSPANKYLEPIPSESLDQTNFKALKVNIKSDSRIRMNSSSNSPKVMQRSYNYSKRHENYFDKYVKEKEIDLSVENELFPKEMNEKIQFVPSPYNFEFLVWGEPKYTSKTRICKQNRTNKELKNLVAGSFRNENSFIRKSKIADILKSPNFKFPKYYKNKPIDKSLVF